MKRRFHLQKGEVASLVTLVGLSVLVLGIVAGGTLVSVGTRFLPKAFTGSQTSILVPVEDTYVTSESPNTNFGFRERLAADGRYRKTTYLKFDLSQLSNVRMTSVNLFLRVINPTNGILFIRNVSNTTWQEESVTYLARPGISGTITSFAASQNREIITIDLTAVAAAKAGEMLSLAIETDNPDGFQFYSEEAESYNSKPKLTVVYTPLPTGMPTSTPEPPAPTLTAQPTGVPNIIPSETPTPSQIGPTPTPQTLASCERRITSHASDQYSPAVSGARAVWADNRNGNPDIYLFDIAQNTETRISDDPSDQLEPKIYGSNIVWADWRNGNADIYAYDVTTLTTTRITSNISEQMHPVIFGNRIAWQDNRNGNWDIYAYDFTTGVEARITNDPADQTSPSLSQERIVWEDRRHGQYEIYAYDFSINAEKRMTNNTADQYTPTTSTNSIAWRDERAGNVDIFATSVASGSAEQRITQNIAQQVAPNMYGDRLVWEDYRNGNWDIYMYDFLKTMDVRVTDNAAHQRHPNVSDQYIVWEDRQTGNYDIHALSLTCGAMHFFPSPTVTPTAAPSPTPTPDPTCLCQTNTATNDEECHVSCVFDKRSDVVSYRNPVQCTLPTSQSTAQRAKNSWCTNVTRTRGDANRDAKIDLVDYDYYRRYVLGDTSVPGEINADFNGDGEVGFNDVTIIRKAIL